MAACNAVDDGDDTECQYVHETECQYMERMSGGSIRTTVLSNGNHACVDVVSGEILFEEDELEEYSYELSSSHDDEPPAPEHAPVDTSKSPVVLELHKDQTPLAIQTMLLRASATLRDHKDQISDVHVKVTGFEDQVAAVHRPSKKRFAAACELGLLGLLHAFGYQDAMVETYATAYSKAQIKDGQVVIRGMRDVNDQIDFAKRVDESMNAYALLLSSHPPAKNDTRK